MQSVLSARRVLPDHRLSLRGAHRATTPLVSAAEATDLMPAPASVPAQVMVDSTVNGQAQTEDSLPSLDVPPMRIVVLLTGTLGDVMPFIQMALMMTERYGHVVRICSHGDLRAPVEKAGLRFYPLHGNARQMAGW